MRRVRLLMAAVTISTLSLVGGPAGVIVRQASAQATTTYTVVSGDYLYGIASKTGTPISTLLSLNNLTLTSMIYPGQKLIVVAGGTTTSSSSSTTATSSTSSTSPSTGATTTYTVVSGDSLYGIASKTATPISTLLSLNNLTLTSKIYPGQKLLVLAGGPSTSSSTTSSTVVGNSLVRRVPLAKGVAFSYGTTHHDYPATDIFAACGAQAVSPIDGVVSEVRRVDLWTSTVDNPATRGGRYVTVLGDDGVRYYMAHFASIRADIGPGSRVAVGQPIAAVGKSGRAGSCHVHFGLSLPCPGLEWAVRRGVIYPWPYLDKWRAGTFTSPRPALNTWFGAHPTACTDAMALPTAADS